MSTRMVEYEGYHGELPHTHQANYSTDRGKPCPLIDVYDSMDNEGQFE